MEIEENPRRKRRRRKKSGSSAKRRSAKRSNPAPKRRRRRRAARRNPAVARSNPPKRTRRRRAMRRTSRRRGRGFRRNPSMPAFATMGAWALGGGLARGGVYLAEKIPVDNIYAQLGIKAAVPLVVGIGSALAGFDKIAAGSFGAFGFQTPDLVIAAYNQYKATSTTTKDTKTMKGLGSIRSMAAGRPGFQSVRGGGARVAAH